jgi:hypothetical protein
MRRFFHQRVGERAESLQERLLLALGECAERLFEGTRSCGQPRADSRLRLRREPDDGATPVGRILPAGEEAVILELAGERRRGGEGQAELAGEFADGALSLAADLGEQRDVPAPERCAFHQFEQLGRRAAPRPEAAHDTPQLLPELGDLLLFGYHRVTIIVEEVRGGGTHMCGGHHHRHHGRRGFRGYPNREQWVDRLQAYREHLEEELRNVQELIERLGETQAPAETV